MEAHSSGSPQGPIPTTIDEVLAEVAASFPMRSASQSNHQSVDGPPAGLRKPAPPRMPTTPDSKSQNEPIDATANGPVKETGDLAGSHPVPDDASASLRQTLMDPLKPSAAKAESVAADPIVPRLPRSQAVFAILQKNRPTPGLEALLSASTSSMPESDLGTESQLAGEVELPEAWDAEPVTKPIEPTGPILVFAPPVPAESPPLATRQPFRAHFEESNSSKGSLRVPQREPHLTTRSLRERPRVQPTSPDLPDEMEQRSARRLLAEGRAQLRAARERIMRQWFQITGGAIALGGFILIGLAISGRI